MARSGVGLLLVVVALCGSCQDTTVGPNLPTWEDEPCSTVSRLGQYGDVMARWRAQTDASPYEPGRVAFTGSSSIRFWEPLQEDLAPWAPIQRGFGGSVLWEVVEHIEETVLRHAPSAAVIFAGTNDIFIGLEPEVVADAYRCAVEKIAQGLGDDVSIHYISITPTPSRWPIWDASNEVNRRIADIAAQWPGLHFIDTTPAFLATGEPPDASLFVSDGLHLSDAGYELWRQQVEPHLDQTLAPFPYEARPLASGTRILVDLGPSNPEDGAPTESPDAFGQHWNNWHPVDAQVLLNSGEHIGDLVDTTGTPTHLRLVLASATQFANGIRSGGLQTPDPDQLGSLAVATATQDYLFASDTGTVVGKRGALTIEGLDPAARYGLRLFASVSGLASAPPASTEYLVRGGAPAASAVLVTAENESQVAELRNLAPDETGRLHINFEPADGPSAHLALLELTVQ